MAGIKCPCGLRNAMETEDCKNTNCNACCPLTRQQTNADRIRAMSDEELAKLLLNSCMGSKCGEQPLNEFGSIDCFACRMEWLRQPAEMPEEE